LFEKYLHKLEERIINISDSNATPHIFSFEWFLLGISNGYGYGIRAWLWLYKKGIFKKKILPCFVVSVGNIAVGGAGKTPMAIYIAGLLKEMGKQVVVVSRGYKGRYKDTSVIVSDGDHIFLGSEDSGDEPYMMAKRKSFPVVVGKDRFKAGIKAIDAFNPDVIILDDGFQHLKLKRDLDLLLLDYIDPLGNNRFLPAGHLRETPQTSSQRADVLIFTRSPDNDENSEAVKDVLQYYPDCPWFKTFHVPSILKQIVNKENSKGSYRDVDSLKGKKAVLFSAIAKNRSFYHAMKELGIIVLDHLEFKDHYRYKESDIAMINKAVQKVCADIILTTEKDWAKLDANKKWETDLVVMGIHIQFQESERFQSFLKLKLK